MGGGSLKTALVIGAEKLSGVTDWQDRATCVLFGDGAGAVVLRAGEGHGGILSSVMGSDGRLADLTDTHIVEGPLIVPRFVLRELQVLADSPDKPPCYRPSTACSRRP